MIIVTELILNMLKNWIKSPFNEEHKNKTFTLVIIVLALLLLKSCKSNIDYKTKIEHQQKVSQNNYSALNGKVEILKNKNSELVATRTILYTSAEELKTLNSKLSKELEKEKGRVKTIIDVQTVYESVPVSVPNTVESYGSGKYGLHFNSTYRDSGVYSVIEGVSKFNISDNKINPDSTKILKNSLQIDVIYGIRERNNRIEVFAKSLSPNISFKDIQGAYITDKKSGGILPPDTPTPKTYKWNFGPQIAYNYIITEGRHAFRAFGNLQYKINDYTIGAQFGFGYSPGKAPDIRTGIRVQYNIFKW
jgi:hypothetical protein